MVGVSFKIYIWWFLSIPIINAWALVSLMPQRCRRLRLHLRRYRCTVYIQVLSFYSAIQFFLAILLWKTFVFVIVIVCERIMMRAHICFLRLLLRQRYLYRSLMILDVFVKYLDSSTQQAEKVYLLGWGRLLWTDLGRRAPFLSRVGIHFSSLLILFFFLNIIRELLKTEDCLGVLRCRRLLV